MSSLRRETQLGKDTFADLDEVFRALYYYVADC